MSARAPVGGSALAWVAAGLMTGALSACSAEGGDDDATADTAVVGEFTEGDAT